MAPDFERLARMPCPIASLASSGMRLFNSLLAFSCCRNAVSVLMLQKCRSGLAEHCGEFCPSIGRTHINDADSLDAGSRRLGEEQTRGLAALDATREFLLGCQK